MKLIYLYDEFMRVPDSEEGHPIYIIDGELNEGYEISQKVHEYRYFLAKQAGAEIFQGNTLNIFNLGNIVLKIIKNLLTFILNRSKL